MSRESPKKKVTVTGANELSVSGGVERRVHHVFTELSLGELIK